MGTGPQQHSARRHKKLPTCHNGGLEPPMPMESSRDNPSESPDPAGGAWFRWLSIARVADAALFVATINLLSIPLAGGIGVSAWGLGVASPSLGVSSAVANNCPKDGVHLSFEISQALACYRGYRFTHGFEQKKAALLRFLNSHGISP